MSKGLPISFAFLGSLLLVLGVMVETSTVALALRIMGAILWVVAVALVLPKGWQDSF